MKRVLKVQDRDTGETVHEVDVSEKPDRFVERVITGMLINLNTEKYVIHDSQEASDQQEPT